MEEKFSMLIYLSRYLQLWGSSYASTEISE